MASSDDTDTKIHKKLDMSGALRYLRRIFRNAKEVVTYDATSIPSGEQAFTETWAMWPSYFPKPDELLGRVLHRIKRTGIKVTDYHGTFDENCGWPRRLLHVPTMTSLEWRPGNVYGGIKEPEYAALSYTWGRYRLCGDNKPEVKSLEIKGIPWAVPRVDPDHFSAETFKKVLQRTMITPCWDSMDSGEQKELEKHAVEFIWVDVACIDQEDKHMQMQEVGRQVAIFRRAKVIAMWLSSLWDLDIQPQFSCLHEVGTMLGSAYITEISSSGPTGLEGWGFHAEAAFRDFMSDPWFSSLWTLQEAFIGLHKSIFLSQSGAPVFLPEQAKYHTSSPLSLSLLGGYCYNISHFVGSMSHLYLEERRVLNVMKYIRESGILSVYQSVEMGTFLAARNRKSSRPEDKVYGIMQVFDVRVGASKPDAIRGHTFALEELEDELGLALMQKDQIMAHLFLFNEPAPYGKAWRPSVGKCSVLTGAENKWAIGEVPYANGGETVLSTRNHDGIVWGYFEGCVCPFGQLLKASENVDSHFILSLDAQPTGGGHSSTEPTASHRTTQEFQTTYQARDARADLRKHAAEFVSKYDPEDLFILRFSPGFGDHSWGVVLLRQQEQDTDFRYWHRIGICEWLAYSHVGQLGSGSSTSSVEMKSIDILRGNTKDWVQSEGYWG